MRERLSISPEPDRLTTDTDILGTRIYLFVTSKPDIKYTVVLKAGSEDIYGNKIKKDYTFTFYSAASASENRARAYPVINGTLMTAGAYDDKARLDLMVLGNVAVDFTLRRLPVSAVYGGRVFNHQYDECSGAYSSTPYDLRTGYNAIKLPDGTVARRWTQQFDGGQGEQPVHQSTLLASEKGGKLAPGLYLVQMKTSSDQFYEVLLSVSTLNLTVKRTPGEIFVWATDIAGATPAAGIPLTAHVNGKAIPLGRTDANGIVRASLEVPMPYPWYERDLDFVYVTAETGSAYGLWYSCQVGLWPPHETYLYTDRPIYRPGEKVYLKGIIRNRQDMTLTPPTGNESVHVRLFKYAEQGGQTEIASADRPVNAFGSFDAEFSLPPDTAPGTVFIEMGTAEELEALAQRYGDMYPYPSLPSISFQVADFRPPAFQVTVAAEQAEIEQGDPLLAHADASYYFGGPVNSANVDWTMFVMPGWFDYKGQGTYTFRDERWSYFYFRDQDQGTVQSDSSGGAVIRATQTALSQGDYTSSDDLAPSNQPLQMLVEATVRDESGSTVSARSAPVMAHPASVYVGLAAKIYGIAAGQANPIRLIAVRPDSTPVAGQAIPLIIVRFTWEYSGPDDIFGNPSSKEIRTPVTSTTLKTGADGTAVYDYLIDTPGVYRVEARTADTEGRISSQRPARRSPDSE